MNPVSKSGPAGNVGAKSGRPTKSAIDPTGRLVMLVLFLIATFPTLPFLISNFPVLRALIPVHMIIHALPLMITAYIDALFLDGGEVGPELIPLWSTLTGVMLWPLVTLAIWPALWNSFYWRAVIAIYTIVALLATIGAVYWVITHSGVFF